MAYRNRPSKNPSRYHERGLLSTAELLMPGFLSPGAGSRQTSEHLFDARAALPFDLHLVSQPAQGILLPLHANRPRPVDPLERAGEGGTGLGVARISIGEKDAVIEDH